MVRAHVVLVGSLRVVWAPLRYGSNCAVYPRHADAPSPLYTFFCWFIFTVLKFGERPNWLQTITVGGC